VNLPSCGRAKLRLLLYQCIRPSDVLSRFTLKLIDLSRVLVHSLRLFWQDKLHKPMSSPIVCL